MLSEDLLKVCKQLLQQYMTWILYLGGIITSISDKTMECGALGFVNLSEHLKFKYDF